MTWQWRLEHHIKTNLRHQSYYLQSLIHMVSYIVLSECFRPFQLIFVSLFSSAKFKETKWLQLDTSISPQKRFRVDTPDNVAIYFNLLTKKTFPLCVSRIKLSVSKWRFKGWWAVFVSYPYYVRDHNSNFFYTGTINII